MAVRTDLLNVVTAERKIGVKNRLAVFVKGHDLDKPVRRDHRSVHSRNVLSRVESEGDSGDLIVHADAELLVLLKDLCKTYLSFLTVVHETDSGIGDLDLLTGVNKLCGIDFRVDDHAARSFRFADLVFAKIEKLAFRNTVFTGNYGIHNFTRAVSESAVRSVDIFRSSDLISRAGKTMHLVNGLIDPGAFGYRREDFTGLGDSDHALLGHVGEAYLDDPHGVLFGGIVFSDIKGNSLIAEHIAVGSGDFNQLIAGSVLQHFRGDQHAFIVGVEGVNSRH